MCSEPSIELPDGARSASTEPVESAVFMHKLRLIERQGYRLDKDCFVLDFGCGAGDTVRQILASGYPNAFGYDVVDYLSPGVDRSRFRIDPNGTIPFQDDLFDLVLSDQVFEHVLDQHRAFSEIFRVLKPGGHAIHIIPARYQLVEPHIRVPLGGLICSRWYYKFWALLGIRNDFQKGLSPDAVADKNATYSITGLRYVENSAYRALWRTIGYTHEFVEQAFLETSGRDRNRRIAKLMKLLPPFWWLFRTFRTRIVYMHKPLPVSDLS